MSLSRDIAVMRKTPMLAGLEEEHLRLLAFSSETRHLGPGEVLFEMNSAAPGAGVVASGAIAVTDPGSTRPRRDALGPGGMINGVSLLLENRPSVRAVATAPSEVILLGRAQFRRILIEYPETARDLQERLSRNLMAMTQDLDAVSTRLSEVDRLLNGGRDE
ncbi:Crp/Fnr family transcriptional regulator [Amorphus orientalis]|uniref:CRP-like cAMP-binding protein n=1 Tax=Amorphus orientalis TaxID=649198 RepID=A0AAE3VKH0_9HYPH|nr:cyclic nucleotide-binding domain-containing protein [Amorphus orientalis]MDQ0313593.1 CRP-like cAMP-binding protein [Amorphus orientalis]